MCVSACVLVQLPIPERDDFGEAAGLARHKRAFILGNDFLRVCVCVCVRARARVCVLVQLLVLERNDLGEAAGEAWHGCAVLTGLDFLQAGACMHMCVCVFETSWNTVQWCRAGGKGAPLLLLQLAKWVRVQRH
eukprot:758868-Pelagomonas_calceolata.AAC.4